MYATNNNPQAIASRSRIRDALLTLMATYPYKDITITQICQEAAIVRQTYYRNFEQKDDILKFHLDQMVKHFFIDYFKEDDVHTQLMTFFTYMLSNQRFLQLTSQNNLFFMIEQIITENITAFLTFQQVTDMDQTRLKQYVTNFIAAAICSLLALWVENRFVETPEMMSRLAQQFLSGINNIDEHL